MQATLTGEASDYLTFKNFTCQKTRLINRQYINKLYFI